MDNFTEPLKELAKHLTKKAETQPGWLYLLIVTYGAVAYFGMPQRVAFGSWTVDIPKLSNELWASLITYLSYQIGDALDKVTFKKRGKKGKWDEQRYQPPALLDARENARRELGIREGSYGVCMRILEAANEGKLSVHFINESSKFIRSLIVPGYIASLIVAFHLPIGLGVLLAFAASVIAYILAYHFYPRMKVRHMTNLYRTVPSIIEEDRNRKPEERKLFIQDVGEIRLFLWEGEQIASVRKPAPTKAVQMTVTNDPSP